MKKLAAISVLHIYLLSLVGQLAVYQYLNYRADKFFAMQADAGRYKIDDLVEVKIPAKMPAFQGWRGYENVNGRVEFANAAYNYVKMRVTKDAVYLMCIPNYETTRLCADNIIHAENINGIQIPVKDHVPYGKTVMIDGLTYNFNTFEFTSPFKTSAIRMVKPVINFAWRDTGILEQPPKFLS